jgi:hypothetical protein
MKLFFSLLTVCCLQSHLILAQRQYTNQSVLATGTWFKIGVVKENVYKIDVPFLQQLGINTAQLRSSSLKVVGNGGAMVDESNASPRPDDLIENAIEIVDGGDGFFNDNDYLLFYAPGTERWTYSNVSNSFQHRKNLISDTAYYFLGLLPAERSISSVRVNGQPTRIIRTFTERFAYEKDTENILSSGKKWWGERFSSDQPTHRIVLDIEGVVPTVPVVIKTAMLLRSINANSTVNVHANSIPIASLIAPAIQTGLLADYAAEVTTISQQFITGPRLTLDYTLIPGNSSATGWLDWIELQFKKELRFINNQPFSFRNLDSSSQDPVVIYSIAQAPPQTTVWDVSAFASPIKITGVHQQQDFLFVDSTDIVKEYFAFDRSKCPSPIALKKISNQNLHRFTPSDYLIITPSVFKSEAIRLADFHQTKNQLSPLVVETEQIYNEFGGGNTSAAAIRDYIKMHYDRSRTGGTLPLRYVLLFGMGHFDTKGRTEIKTNYVPCFESDNSIHTLASYTSDDFFALLSNTDDIEHSQQQDSLRVAVGRAPLQQLADAKIFVDKIINYGSGNNFGFWKNELLVMADDKESNLFYSMSESLSSIVKAADRPLVTKKLYIDAYPLLSSGGKRFSPASNRQLQEELAIGKLIWNYSGHGNYQQFSEYGVLNREEASQLENERKLPLLIAATCEFIPYDNPHKQSIGTQLLSGSKQGVIGVLTAPRLVFAGENQQLNKNIFQSLLLRDASRSHYSLGEAFRVAKNTTSRTTIDKINLRKFSLLGDPALSLAFPTLSITVDSIAQVRSRPGDTIRAAERPVLTGAVRDERGDIQSSFNGTIHLKIFNLSASEKTLGNIAGSTSVNFENTHAILFSGRASVTNGQFSIAVVAPPGEIEQVNRIMISSYAENGTLDAAGIDTTLFLKRIAFGSAVDLLGPTISLYMNDYSFQNGSITHDKPLLLAKLADSSGICTVAEGHNDRNIKLIIDNDDGQTFILNKFYDTEQDTYTKGGLSYELPALAKGRHTLTLIAWDNAGNKGHSTLDFYILEDSSFSIYNLHNYPNPVSKNMKIGFELGSPEENLTIDLGFYSASGHLMGKEKHVLSQVGWRVDIPVQTDLSEWPSGIYFYRLVIVSRRGQIATKAKQLIKLN